MKGWKFVPVFSFCMGAFMKRGNVLDNVNEKKTGNTVERIRELAQPLCEELGLFLWDVRFEKEGATWYLRVFIDKDGGIEITDCENFSRPFNKILDEVDPISQQYVFEVGSPGLGRDLKRPEHFECCVGDEVRIKTIRPVEDERDFIGTLVSYENKEFEIEVAEKGTIKLKLTDCSFVKLYDDGDLF